MARENNALRSQIEEDEEEMKNLLQKNKTLIAQVNIYTKYTMLVCILQSSLIFFLPDILAIHKSSISAGRNLIDNEFELSNCFSLHSYPKCKMSEFLMSMTKFTIMSDMHVIFFY